MTECYFCSSTEDIEEHHIVPQRFAGSDAESNTVDVCHECHWKLERLYNKDFWEAIGIRDPRATEEKHITCDMHGCTDPATGQHTITGHTGKAQVHRCDNHSPDGSDTTQSPDRDRSKFESVGDDEGISAEQIEYVFRNWLPDYPADAVDVLDLVGKSARLDRITILSHDPVTHVRILGGGYEYDVEYEGNSWEVTPHPEHESSKFRKERLDNIVLDAVEELDEGDGVQKMNVYDEVVAEGIGLNDLSHSLRRLCYYEDIYKDHEGRYHDDQIHI